MSNQALEISIKKGNEDPNVIVFDKDVIKIGKMKTNDICLDGENVARMHAVLEISKNIIRVIDLGSATGTFVNNNRINKDICVKSGDIIAIDDFTITIGTTTEKVEEILTEEIVDETDKNLNEIFDTNVEIDLPVKITIHIVDKISDLLEKLFQCTFVVLNFNDKYKSYDRKTKAYSILYSHLTKEFIWVKSTKTDFDAFDLKIKKTNKNIEHTLDEKSLNIVNTYWKNIPSIDEYLSRHPETIIEITKKNGATLINLSILGENKSTLTLSSEGLNVNDAFAILYAKLKADIL